MKILASINHGRWIAVCPACASEGMTVAVQVQPGDVFICPAEYPEVLANMLVPHPHKKGAFLSVPDDDARKQAVEIAIREGVFYEIEFPADKVDIERVLRVRPVMARNWNHDGTTLAELQAENLLHGVNKK